VTRNSSAELTGGDLAEIWRNAAVFLPHFVGCTCVGTHLILDRDAIESDLLAYLVQVYRDSGKASLARFVAARENESPRSSFAAWLTSLDAAKIDSEDHSRLFADLTSSLRSLDASNTERNFLCE
jgi:hypothetical protein